jgi:myo-inositol-1(or 4)-monophosphatase
VSAPDPDELLALAVDLADRAGALALSMRGGVGDSIEVSETKTTPTDVVTAADTAAERLIVDGLRRPGPATGCWARRARTTPARPASAG